MRLNWLLKKSDRAKRWVRKARFEKAKKINHSSYLPEGIDRVYHIHIRKSAGTSLNNVFFNQAGLSLQEFWREPVYIKNEMVFVQHQKEPINAGNYFYASSHYPIWELNLKPNTFTYCILRNPIDRLVSLYKYYCWVNQVDDKTGYSMDPSYYVLLAQEHLLNKSFTDFVKELSSKYLSNQLFIFDKDLNPEKALERLTEVNKVYFFDKLDFAITDLTATLNLKPTQLTKERNFQNVLYQIEPEELIKAQELLIAEIEFYERARLLYLK